MRALLSVLGILMMAAGFGIVAAYYVADLVPGGASIFAGLNDGGPFWPPMAIGGAGIVLVLLGKDR
jgi:hypothetical protein